jgi:hypothetical protein
VAGRLPGVLRDQFLQLDLGAFVLLVRQPRTAEVTAHSAQLLDVLMSTVRTASSRGRGGSIPNRRGVSPLCTQRPELLLRGDQEVLVRPIGMDSQFDPLAAPGCRITQFNN